MRTLGDLGITGLLTLKTCRRDGHCIENSVPIAFDNVSNTRELAEEHIAALYAAVDRQKDQMDALLLGGQQ